MVRQTSKLFKKAGERIMILGDVKRGIITLKQASVVLNISYRHAKRLWGKFKKLGPMGLVTKRRNTPSWNKITEEVKLKIMSVKERFSDINCCHLADVLKEEGITISHETVRRVLIKNHLYLPKHKRRPRKRFEADQAGKLVQMDTSPYHWIPAIDKELQLILALDDHSRKPLVGRIVEHDTTWENMCSLREIVEKYGLFDTLYVDQDSKFKYSRTNQSLYFNYQKQPEEVDTQIHQALKDLGIILLPTHRKSPWEKGKVERFFGFLQQRLPIEFQRHNITTREQANPYLNKWLKKHGSQWIHHTTGIIPDERFKNSCFRPLPKAFDLNQIFCLREKRKVKKDNTFSYKGKIFQLTNFSYRAYWGKTEIDLKIIPKKQISAYYQGKLIQKFRYNGEK